MQPPPPPRRTEGDRDLLDKITKTREIDGHIETCHPIYQSQYSFAALESLSDPHAARDSSNNRTREKTKQGSISHSTICLAHLPSTSCVRNRDIKILTVEYLWPEESNCILAAPCTNELASSRTSMLYPFCF